MNSYIYFFSISIFFFSSASVFSQNCSSPEAQKFIENSEMKVSLMNNGGRFWDGNMLAAYYQPYIYGQATVSPTFSSGTWMAATMGNGNLCLAAHTYGSGPGNDYSAGPLNPINGLPYPNACNNFDRIWKVKRWAIERHISDWNDNGIIDGPTDRSLLKWPGKNNPQFAAQMGFVLPFNHDLAPFYDRNGDGNYQPLQGDYPVYDYGNASAVAEEMLWSVFNDNGNLHSLTGGNPLQAEIQQTAWLFGCNNDDLLNQTLFLKHKIINRNVENWYDYHYAAWSDVDLGHYSDDYRGTAVSKNTIFAYNQDNFDPSYPNLNGYGANPPVQAVTFLNHNLKYSMHYWLGGGMQLSSTLSYYNLMQALFPDGTPLTKGGDGYQTSTDTVHFAFDGPPMNPSGWSMLAASLIGYDTRTVGTVFTDSLLSGDAFEVDMAYSYHRHPDSNYYQNVNVMLQQVDSIQAKYDYGLNSSCNPIVLCSNNCVYPGDANNNGIANDFDILEMGLHYGQSAAQRTVLGNNWQPYSPPTPPNNAYVDADGNTGVDSLDFEANSLNFMETHSLNTGIAEGDNTLGNDLYFKRYYHDNLFFFVQQDTVVNLGNYLALDIYLGDTSSNILDLYGVTFRVAFDETVLHLFDIANLSGYGHTDLKEGWLNDDGATSFARYMSRPGKIHYVCTRNGQVNYSKGGWMGRILLRVRQDAFVNADRMSTQICFEDFKAIRADGNTVNIGAECIDILYRDSNFVTSTSVPFKQASTVRIYPNPAKEYVDIDLRAHQVNTLALYDLLGKCIYEASNPQGIHRIHSSGISSGIHFLKVEFEHGFNRGYQIIFDKR